jgi:acid phosphatase class B
MAFASAGARTPFITRIPNSAVTFSVPAVGAAATAVLALLSAPSFEPANSGTTKIVIKNEAQMHRIDLCMIESLLLGSPGSDLCGHEI